MNSENFAKVFGVRRRYFNIEDFFGAIFHGVDAGDKKYRKALEYYFGFAVKPGDMVCAVLLRKKPGAKNRRKR